MKSYLPDTHMLAIRKPTEPSIYVGNAPLCAGNHRVETRDIRPIYIRTKMVIA